MSSNNSRHTVAAYPFSKREDDGVSDEKQKQQQQQQQHEMDAETGLRQLKAELDSIPDNMKASFVHAQHVAPDLVCDQHLSRFLYAEGYDVKVSETFWKQFPYRRCVALIAPSKQTRIPKIISSQREG